MSKGVYKGSGRGAEEGVLKLGQEGGPKVESGKGCGRGVSEGPEEGSGRGPIGRVSVRGVVGG